MESKTARMTILVDPAIKKAFEELCERHDLTPSQVLRRLMREHLAEHGMGSSAVEPVSSRREARK